jgi:hypothetical protein
MTDTPYVSNFDINVTVGDGAFIALDKDLDYIIEDKEYGAYVSADEIYAYLKNQSAFSYEVESVATIKALTHGTFMPDSTGKIGAITVDNNSNYSNSIAENVLNMDLDGIKPETFVNALLPNETNYYSFRFFFRSKDPYFIYLDGSQTTTGFRSQVITSLSANGTTKTTGLQYNPYTWHPTGIQTIDDYYTGYANAGYDASNNSVDFASNAANLNLARASAADAVRIAFSSSSQLLTDNDAKVDLALQNVAQVKKIEPPIIWDPNSGKGWADGKIESGSLVSNLAWDLYTTATGETSAGRLPLATDNFAPYDSNNIDPDGKVTYGKPMPTLLLETYKPYGTEYFAGYITVTLYLEGYDGNALNAALADVLTTSLSFKGVKDNALQQASQN